MHTLWSMQPFWYAHTCSTLNAVSKLCGSANRPLHQHRFCVSNSGISTCLQAATGLADGTLKVNREKSGMKKVMKMLLEDNSFGRSIVFNKGTLPLKLQPIPCNQNYFSHPGKRASRS
jgi:hypothetical protein